MDCPSKRWTCFNTGVFQKQWFPLMVWNNHKSFVNEQNILVLAHHSRMQGILQYADCQAFDRHDLQPRFHFFFLYNGNELLTAYSCFYKHCLHFVFKFNLFPNAVHDWCYRTIWMLQTCNSREKYYLTVILLLRNVCVSTC